MKYALIDSASGFVKQWQDESLFGYPDAQAGEARIALDQDFEFPATPHWHVGGNFVEQDPSPPPAPDLGAAVRAERDARLAACDWSQLRDVPDATAALWAPYRQALRDLTSQARFPTSVTWPTPPAA